MNSPRTLILLGVVFAGLVIFTILSGREPASQTTIPPTPTDPAETLPSGSLLRVFPDMRVIDIQAIRIDDPINDRNFTLVRDEQGNWTAPDLDAELDDEQVRNIARTIVLLPYARSINIVPETDFEDYGLTQTPRLLLQILNLDGASHVIAVGNLIDSERAYYVLVDERDEIFQVERGAIDFLRNFVLSPPIRLTK